MMARTVIRFEPSGDAVWLNLDRAPIEFTPDSWPIDLAALTGDTLVELGRSLSDLLINREPVRGVLTSAFRSGVDAPPSPIYFHVRAGTADAIPWEQIYAQGPGFCALDGRWPVGRIARTFQTVRGRAFKPPLRIVAVLSAAGQDGSRQLQGLLDAVRCANWGVRLHVITGDETVRDQARGAGVDAALISGNAPDLCKQIARARPHLLHVLCHGRVAAGVRSLSFASIGDFDADVDDFGSINLAVTDLARALKACDPWLVVLSACQMADATSLDSPAYAHQLVENGVTAVIGMRRLVDLNDTDRFCAALYPEVISLVREAVKPPPPGQSVGERVVDWAEALTNPRKVMSGADPGVVDSWLDPVLYAQIDDLRVLPPSEQLSPEQYAELQGKLDQYRGSLATLDRATTDSQAIAEVEALIADAEALLAQAGL